MTAVNINPGKTCQKGLLPMPLMAGVTRFVFVAIRDFNCVHPDCLLMASIVIFNLNQPVLQYCIDDSNITARIIYHQSVLLLRIGSKICRCFDFSLYCIVERSLVVVIGSISISIPTIRWMGTDRPLFEASVEVFSFILLETSGMVPPFLPLSPTE